MARRTPKVIDYEQKADVSIWKEALFGAELLLLHASPVFYGFGIPHGNNEPVIVIPGFLGTDLYLTHLRNWLSRIGYRAYMSGISLNAECPNLLIRQHLNEAIELALQETGERVHLIGHSLGGVIARSVAHQRPDDVASVVTSAAPFCGAVAHRSVLAAAEYVRKRILAERGTAVMPNCYTPRCTCDFVQSLQCDLPESIIQTAIYTQDDGIVDWTYCLTEEPEDNFEVPGTHIGLVFNASVYRIIADRLAFAMAQLQ